MVRASLSELLEALGAVVVVVGLAFLSPPVALVAAGVFLLIVANAPAAPGSAPLPDPAGPGRRRQPKPPSGPWRPNPAITERAPKL